MAVGDQIAPFVCGDHHGVGGIGRGGARLARLFSRMAQCERHASTLDIERCAIALHREQDDVVASLLSNGERSQGSAFDLHDGLVREQADDIDVHRAHAGRAQQAEG